MADITRWDPFAEVATLRQTLDRMFEDVRPFRAGGNGEGSYFPVDVFDDGDEIVVKASLPGVKPEDLDIQVHGDVLTIKGEMRDEKEEKAQNWYRRERRYGASVRNLQLPGQVDAASAAATFEDGVLRLSLPKAESEKPKTIKVTPKAQVTAG